MMISISEIKKYLGGELSAWNQHLPRSEYVKGRIDAYRWFFTALDQLEAKTKAKKALEVI